MKRRTVCTLAALMMGTLLFVSAAQARVTWHRLHIYGIHSWAAGASGVMGGRGGWCVQTIRSSETGWAGTFQAIQNEGFSIICRINWAYQGDARQGTIPTNSAYWTQFANECAARVNQLKEYCNIWVIGNEMNVSWEGPIPPANYVTCFRQVRTAIKNVQPEATVCVGAVGPYNSTTNGDSGYRPYPTSDPNYANKNYLYQISQVLGPDVDGYALHTYGGRWTGSNYDADPRDDNSWGFGVFKDYMEVLSRSEYAKAKPVYITEMNTNTDAPPTTSYRAGWMQKAFQAINDWNASHAHQIQCLCWFVYQHTGWESCALTNPDPETVQAKNDFINAASTTSYINTGITASFDWRLDVGASNLTSMDWNDIKELSYLIPWDWSGQFTDWGSGGVVESGGVSDRFVVWSAKTFWASSSGNWQFRTGSDEGSWLWVDGQIVVYNHGLHGTQWVAGTKALKTGPHFVFFKMFENTGTASAGYNYKIPGSPYWAVINSMGSLGAANVWALDTGASNPNSSDLNQINPSYYAGSFNWRGDNLTGGQCGLSDYFIIEQMRYFWVPTDGTYWFGTGSDDGSWFWVDGQIVVNNYGLHGYQWISGSKYLKRGMHVLYFKYFDWTGGQTYRYQWYKPGGSQWETIP